MAAKYHILRGPLKAVETKEFKNDVEAAAAAEEDETIIRIQHSETRKYAFERGVKPSEAKAEE